MSHAKYQSDWQKKCFADPDCNKRINSRQRRWKAEHPEAARNHHYRSRYGITYDDKLAMAEVQDWRCAVCGTPKTNIRDLHIDHDHSTNEVRGLLCRDCNLGLGNFKDDADVLIRAAEYIKGRSNVQMHQDKRWVL